MRLSICIPTYNFGLFIGETLKGVAGQSSDHVDVVVVDGGSTDNTREVVTGLQRLYPWIAYHRLDKRGGIDKDMAMTVELARGDYCWLLSSDDVIKPGAIQRVLNEIKNGNDIYICNRTECDRDLIPVKDRIYLSNTIEDHVFNFSTPADLIPYFDKAHSIGALFSYMSSIIVRRDKWNEIKYDEGLTGSNYAHVFRLFSILLKGGALKYIREPLILCRGDNDSFLNSGRFNRVSMDFDGYLLLASRLFSDVSIKTSFLAVMRREFKWNVFIALKKSAPDNARWNDFERKLIEFGYSPVQLFIVRFLNSSRFLYAVFRYCWLFLNGIRSGATRFVRWKQRIY